MTAIVKANKKEIAWLKKIAAKFEKNAPREMNAAINETTKQIRTFASRLIRDRLAAKKKDIDNKLRRRVSNRKSLNGVLYVSEKTLGIGKFTKSQTKKGVSVRIAKKGSRVLFPGAFGPKREKIKPYAYTRVGKEPFPFKILPPIPFAPNVKAQGGLNKIKAESQVLLKKNMQRRLRLLELRSAGKVPDSKRA